MINILRILINFFEINTFRYKSFLYVKVDFVSVFEST